MKNVLILLSLFSLLTPFAQARPLVVFDLDHTLVDTNGRIIALMREIGVDLNLPQLLALDHRQVEALKSGDFSTLGIEDSKTLALLIGDRVQKGDRKTEGRTTSLFGRKFYLDSSYLIYDTVMPGAPEFVERLATELDSDILYMTGRIKEHFEEATKRQLEYYNFPGFGARSQFRDRVRLVLKPESYVGSTDDFKVEELKRTEASHRVIAVFDDSRRNINRFRQSLRKEVLVVKLSPNILNAQGLEAGVVHITNYLYNISENSNGERKIADNRGQIDALIDQAKICSRLLIESLSEE